MGGFLDGLASITAEKIGTKVGLSLISDILTGPADFFLKKGIEELFGGGNEVKFAEVFQELDEIKNKIDEAVNKISTIVEESNLEDQHSTIDTLFTNFQTVLERYNTLTEGYQAAYDSMFKNDPYEALTTISKTTERIHDRLLGEGSLSTDYLNYVANGMYDTNADIYEFNNRFIGVSALYIMDLMNACHMSRCIYEHVENPNHKAMAEKQIEEIGAYITSINTFVDSIIRDVPNTINHFEDTDYRLFNGMGDFVLGRYAEYNEKSYHISFELKPHGNDYYYLKIVGKNYGIDHYDGEEIKTISNSDSGHPNHLWRFVPSESDPRWFRIQNKATGQILDHYYGRELRAAGFDEHPNHLWEVLPNRAGNGCAIINKATGAAMGLDHKSRLNAYTAGIKVSVNIGSYIESLQLPPNVWNNAHWKILRHESGVFHNLINKMTSQAVDYYDGESFRFVPSPSGHPNHLWKLEPTAVGDTQAYHFLRNQATGAIIDYAGSDHIGGQSDNNAKNPDGHHIWKLLPV